MWCETDESGSDLRRLDKVSRSPLGSFEAPLSGLGGSLHWLDHTICVFVWMAMLCPVFRCVCAGILDTHCCAPVRSVEEPAFVV